MTLQPLKDHVVAKKEQPESKTTSGLILPPASKEAPAYAVVESVGPEVKAIKKGDKIVYKDYSGTTLKINDTEYFIIAEEDVLAILK